MKLQELDNVELQAINGGADQNVAGAAYATIGANSLLSLGFNWSDGKGHSYSWQLDIGKDVHAGIGAGNSGIQS